ncbi:cytochrome P450 [Nocardia sp. NPDC050713]|uniref:cytochrome P450 n=1 Tax=Nocardia sp. NPDC050713 TaxID=3154511 RepID=UPI0033D19D05
MTDTVFDLLDYWSTRRDQWVDIADSTNRFTLEVIGRAGFSYSFDSFTRRDEHPFVAAMTRGLRHINRNANLPPVLHDFPRRRAEQHRRDVTFAHQLVDDVIATRRREDPDSTGDLLGLMLNHADPATGEKLDEINIRHQILTFLVAGHETSAGALAFALYFLATHLDVAAQARAEVDERWPAPGRADIEYHDVSKLRYLRRVVDEIAAMAHRPTTSAKPGTPPPSATVDTHSNGETGFSGTLGEDGVPGGVLLGGRAVRLAAKTMVPPEFRPMNAAHAPRRESAAASGRRARRRGCPPRGRRPATVHPVG